MRYIRHKLMVYNTEKVVRLHNSLDHESIEFLRTCFVNFGVLLNVICKRVAITAACGFTEKYDKKLGSSRLGFAPPSLERYSLGPLGVTVSTIVWPDTV